MFKKQRREAPQTRPDHPHIARARKLANLMDSAFTIPIINKKIGLDPLLDLIPIPLSGDLVATMLAAYIIWVAWELRLPAHIIRRMIVNVAIDLLLGAIPLGGFVLDAIWKSNVMNFKLLEEAYQQYGVGPRYDSSGKPIVEVIAEPV